MKIGQLKKGWRWIDDLCYYQSLGLEFVELSFSIIARAQKFCAEEGFTCKSLVFGRFRLVYTCNALEMSRPSYHDYRVPALLSSH